MSETKDMKPKSNLFSEGKKERRFFSAEFRTIKTAADYLGRFLDCKQTVEYFDRYFTWYNSGHLHSGIDYVTPDQCHQGLREIIVAHRKLKHEKQRLLRKEVNRSKQNLLTNDPITLIVNPNQIAICSVMNF